MKRDYQEIFKASIFDDLQLTERQQEILKLFRKGLKQSEIAEKLYITSASVHDVKTTLLNKAQALKGTSSLIKTDEKSGDSKTVLKWEKTNYNDELKSKLLDHYVNEVKKKITPKPKVKAPKVYNKDLCNQFILTDYHIGMLATKALNKDQNWNTKSSLHFAQAFIDIAIERAPQANTAIFVNLGDFLHHDDIIAQTTLSKHSLDSDSRLFEMIEVGNYVYQYFIDSLLKTHKNVHVITAEGNHDMRHCHALRSFMPMLYRNNPRVTFDKNHSPYHAYQFGNNGLFYHHGHMKIGIKQGLDRAFAAQFPTVFGKTTFRYGHVGHFHSRKTEESNIGMVIEQHRTLAAADAYASNHGFQSGRSADVITYHRTEGEYSRQIVYAKTINDLLRKRGLSF